MRSADKIDAERLKREARIAEHGEAYQPMGRRDGIRIGVGARFTPPDETDYFIEVVVPVSTGQGVDLEEMEAKLNVLRRLQEEGFSLISQEDSSISCELQTQGEDLVRDYENAISCCQGRE